jgi:DNA-directed RNA polymerase specialized sigma24 family protein
MEASVIQVSHYLDRRAVALFEQDTGALLACAFYRRLRRQLAKLRRLELAADVSHLTTPQVGRSCVSKEDCHLDAEKVVRQLSDRTRQMYELRNAGYEWKEIANKFEISDAAARAEFSRELRRLRRKLLRNKRLPMQNPPDAGEHQ